MICLDPDTRRFQNQGIEQTAIRDLRNRLIAAGADNDNLRLWTTHNIDPKAQFDIEGSYPFPEGQSFDLKTPILFNVRTQNFEQIISPNDEIMLPVKVRMNDKLEISKRHSIPYVLSYVSYQLTNAYKAKEEEEKRKRIQSIMPDIGSRISSLEDQIFHISQGVLFTPDTIYSNYIERFSVYIKYLKKDVQEIVDKLTEGYNAVNVDAILDSLEKIEKVCNFLEDTRLDETLESKERVMKFLWREITKGEAHDVIKLPFTSDVDEFIMRTLPEEVFMPSTKNVRFVDQNENIVRIRHYGIMGSYDISDEACYPFKHGQVVELKHRNFVKCVVI